MPFCLKISSIFLPSRNFLACSPKHSEWLATIFINKSFAKTISFCLPKSTAGNGVNFKNSLLSACRLITSFTSELIYFFNPITLPIDTKNTSKVKANSTKKIYLLKNQLTPVIEIINKFIAKINGVVTQTFFFKKAPPRIKTLYFHDYW